MQPRKWGIRAKLVMPGLVPGIHVLIAAAARETWMAGSPSAKTRFALLPGHDEKRLIFKRLERPRKCWVHFGSYSEEATKWPSRRMASCRLMVRDGASAPAHHEGDLALLHHRVAPAPAPGAGVGRLGAAWHLG